MDTLKQKRQYFHQLLIRLGEVKYKELIVEAEFGVTSTSQITEEWKLDKLIADALNRLKQNDNKPAIPKSDSDKKLRHWRNRCLLVLAERGISATAKDWSSINDELSKKQYQWIMTGEQINRRGFYAFSTVKDLQKLFKQLCSIRDNEQIRAEQLKKLAMNN